MPNGVADAAAAADEGVCRPVDRWGGLRSTSYLRGAVAGWCAGLVRPDTIVPHADLGGRLETFLAHLCLKNVIVSSEVPTFPGGPPCTPVTRLTRPPISAAALAFSLRRSPPKAEEPVDSSEAPEAPAGSRRAQHATIPAETVRALVAAHHPDVANGTSEDNMLTLMIDSNGNYVGSASSKANIVSATAAVRAELAAALAAVVASSPLHRLVRSHGGGRWWRVPRSPPRAVSPAN